MPCAVADDDLFAPQAAVLVRRVTLGCNRMSRFEIQNH